ncbi:MAG: UDP-N-acetylmuramoyl-L-alanyl-D-glutamate--2,6-diaminopimelate ligase, partial [Planctomycetota bacterium]|nr:UDP-N-acetylmuramoyl-L-alanyl-D-glutamate--2,6-diaminopimelate ligase [Planctomycetota bacterium]
GLSGRSLWLHPRPAEVLGAVAADVHGRPADRLEIAVVTGTNGKTSVCHLVGQLLDRAELSPAVLGTAGHRLRSARGPLSLASSHTTPDVAALQALLAGHVEGGGRTAVMEASSHGLVQGRLAGLAPRVAAFTNLTREHLDYHGSMERYLDAKARVWDLLAPGDGVAVVFGRSDASLEMRRRAEAAGARVITVDVGAEADLTAREVRRTRAGWSFVLAGLGLPSAPVELPLPGRHNVENALVAAAVARSMGASAAAVAAGLASAAAPPGRLERVSAGSSAAPFEVMVDYAHSPDAMERVLEELRRDLDGRDEAGRLICVFGCGGDRDRGKRAPMGRAAGRIADVSVVTSDNPRSEDPAAIAETVLEGIDAAGGRRVLELDRGRAIERALGMARRGDVVLIAGKGHENTQTVAGRSLPFDDRVVAAEALARLVAEDGGSPS